MTHPPEMLILAVSRMRGGVCVAGMTGEPAPASGLRWVRPVKAHGHLLLGDIRYERSARGSSAGGSHVEAALMRLGDVVAWRMGAARPSAPHIEDVLVDPVRERARLLRHHDSLHRAQFCAGHLDRSPDDVLLHETRSLCLLRPTAVRAIWSHDSYSGHYEARMAFQTTGFSTEPRGVPVTDVAWRALGRTWLAGDARLELDDVALRERVGEIYLAVGRGRAFEGRRWLLVVGVHAEQLPEVEIDETML
jgi:hypothetical protein